MGVPLPACCTSDGIRKRNVNCKFIYVSSDCSFAPNKLLQLIGKEGHCADYFRFPPANAGGCNFTVSFFKCLSVLS